MRAWLFAEQYRFAETVIATLAKLGERSRDALGSSACRRAACRRTPLESCQRRWLPLINALSLDAVRQ
jgi:hypothetical protein